MCCVCVSVLCLLRWAVWGRWRCGWWCGWWWWGPGGRGQASVFAGYVVVPATGPPGRVVSRAAVHSLPPPLRGGDGDASAPQRPRSGSPTTDARFTETFCFYCHCHCHCHCYCRRRRRRRLRFIHLHRQTHTRAHAHTHTHTSVDRCSLRVTSCTLHDETPRGPPLRRTTHGAQPVAQLPQRDDRPNRRGGDTAPPTPPTDANR